MKDLNDLDELWTLRGPHAAPCDAMIMQLVWAASYLDPKDFYENPRTRHARRIVDLAREYLDRNHCGRYEWP